VEQQELLILVVAEVLADILVVRQPELLVDQESYI
tara:strand:+ start:450 stop:554 length:105 start_codon:yes stop_codon:yes gene_type:complete